MGIIKFTIMIQLKLKLTIDRATMELNHIPSSSANVSNNDVSRESENHNCPLASQKKIPGKRILLNDRLATEIFLLKSSFQQIAKDLDKTKGHSSLVSKLFGISPKTVRDIWNFRTWRHVTLKLSTCDENCMIASSEAMKLSLPDTLQNHEAFSASINQGSCSFLSLSAEAHKRVGRPLGSKDKRPRRRRAYDKVTYSKESPIDLSLPILAQRGISSSHDSSPAKIMMPATACRQGHWSNVSDDRSPMHIHDAQMNSQFSQDSNFGHDIMDPQLSRTYPFFLRLDI